MRELGLATSASAECAWVLWVRTQAPGAETRTSVLNAYEQERNVRSRSKSPLQNGGSSTPMPRWVKVTAETVWVWREEDPAATTMTWNTTASPTPWTRVGRRGVAALFSPWPALVTGPDRLRQRSWPPRSTSP
jgi:hypothetical protein